MSSTVIIVMSVMVVPNTV